MPWPPDWTQVAIEFPRDGAWRLHHAPSRLSHRETGSAPDRFDDPKHEYRVRYLATTFRGAALEVLDHFRPNAPAESRLDEIDGIDGIDILQDDPAGSVPENWLSNQRIALAVVAGSATPQFADVTNVDLLASLNERPRVRAKLSTTEARAALGSRARLDEGTIRLVGPVGRAITQAVSREIYGAGLHGIAYKNRFDDDEQCWAVFDDRLQLSFDVDEPLDNTPDSQHLPSLNEAARIYELTLPPSWQL